MALFGAVADAAMYFENAAAFGFHKTATGSFSFTFNITLTDQPDIKFDYDQNTYVR